MSFVYLRADQQPDNTCAVRTHDQPYSRAHKEIPWTKLIWAVTSCTSTSCLCMHQWRMHTWGREPDHVSIGFVRGFCTEYPEEAKQILHSYSYSYSYSNTCYVAQQFAWGCLNTRPENIVQRNSASTSIRMSMANTSENCCRVIASSLKKICGRWQTSYLALVAHMRKSYTHLQKLWQRVVPFWTGRSKPQDDNRAEFSKQFCNSATNCKKENTQRKFRSTVKGCRISLHGVRHFCPCWDWMSNWFWDNTPHTLRDVFVVFSFFGNEKRATFAESFASFVALWRSGKCSTRCAQNRTKLALRTASAYT